MSCDMTSGSNKCDLFKVPLESVISMAQVDCVSSRQLQDYIPCRFKAALILIEMTNTISTEFVSDAKWRRVIVF